MEIKIGNEQFYVPDEIGTDKSKSVKEIYDVAIPLDIYKKQQELKKLKDDLNFWMNQPDEIIIPNTEKENNIILLNNKIEIVEEELSKIAS